MQIKKRLRMNIAVFALAALAIVLVVVVTLYEVGRVKERAEIASEIAVVAFERSSYRTEYLETNSEQSKTGWFARSEQLRTLLKKASDEFEEDREKIDKINKSNEAIVNHFRQIVENREKGLRDPRAAARAQETEIKLVRQLNLDLYDYSLDALALRNIAGMRLSSMMTSASGVIIVLLVSVTAAAVFNSWSAIRMIAGRVEKLDQGASAIGGGDLGYRIDIKGDDELAGLAEAFNAMSVKLQGSYLQLHDEIVERTRAEEALRESEERFRKVFEEGPLGMHLAGLDLHYIKANSTLCRLVGYSEDELRKLTPFDITHPDDVHKDKELAARLISGSIPYFSLEKRYIRKDGGIIWALLTATQIRSDDGKPLYFLAMIEDITERKEAEEELRASEETLKKSQEIASLGSWDLDLEKNVLTWSDEVYRIFGLKPREFGATYEAFLETVHPDDRAAVDDAYSRSLREGNDTYEIEHRVVRKSTGEVRYVHEKCEHFRDRSGRIVRSVGMVHDITERKLAEQERERLLADLARSNRELEQFAYVASHDLQEPLRMVSSYVQLLEQKYKGRLDEKADRYIHFAVDGADRMQNLIEGLLAYSRITRKGGGFRQVGFNKVFAAAVSNLSLFIRESRAVVSRDDLPAVSGDETQLVQLFQNLISNGIKYGRSDVAPQVHVSAKRDGQVYVFSVRDNGIGIEPQYYDRVFQIFQRLHARGEYSGTGIGLALCKRIVERHHGRIWVESVPGEGTAFFFTIPA